MKNSQYLDNKIFLGFVTENNDPQRIGRVKVRVQDIFEEIPLEHLPWCSPYTEISDKTFSKPAIGKIVNVIFPMGNLYSPQYIYNENYNINLQNKLLVCNDDKYRNFTSLLFDHRTQIYCDDVELMIDYFYNYIKIIDGGISLRLKDNDQIMTIGDEFADQPAVLGKNFFEWFDSFMNILQQPGALVGNLAAPVLRPALDASIANYFNLRPNFISNNIYISDNDKISYSSRDLDRRPKLHKEDDITKINDKHLLEFAEKDLADRIIKERKLNFDELEQKYPDKFSIDKPPVENIPKLEESGIELSEYKQPSPVFDEDEEIQYSEYQKIQEDILTAAKDGKAFVEYEYDIHKSTNRSLSEDGFIVEVNKKDKYSKISW